MFCWCDGKAIFVRSVAWDTHPSFCLGRVFMHTYYHNALQGENIPGLLFVSSQSFGFHVKNASAFYRNFREETVYHWHTQDSFPSPPHPTLPPSAYSSNNTRFVLSDISLTCKCHHPVLPLLLFFHHLHWYVLSTGIATRLSEFSCLNFWEAEIEIDRTCSSNVSLASRDDHSHTLASIQIVLQNVRLQRTTASRYYLEVPDTNSTQNAETNIKRGYRDTGQKKAKEI